MASVPFELKGKSVYVAGRRGMVGSAIVRRLSRENVNLLTVDRREIDLCNQAVAFDSFAKMSTAAAATLNGLWTGRNKELFLLLSRSSPDGPHENEQNTCTPMRSSYVQIGQFA
ncbi:hypothetical protein XH90_12060 [Bradyrhizobium sp. CCBAU 53338]|nr:hypothetical protein XH90_12060 [Bradyrhizobium sp. CCBAU 53338]